MIKECRQRDGIRNELFGEKFGTKDLLKKSHTKNITSIWPYERSCSNENTAKGIRIQVYRKEIYGRSRIKWSRQILEDIKRKELATN